MIQINLLPEELRKQEETPLPRRLAIFAGAGLLTLLACLLLIQRVRTLPNLRQEKTDLGKKLVEASDRVQRDVAPVEKALSTLEQRQKILQKVEENVVRWGPRLDGLQEVLVRDLDGVWITGFAYEERKSKERGKTDQLERILTVDFAASDFSDQRNLFTMSNEERIAEIIRRLSQNRAFMQDTIGISPSTWVQTDDYKKAPWNVKAIAFPITFALRPPTVDKPAPPKKKPAGSPG